MNIIIPGGCGFVGSNLALKLKAKYPGYKIVVLDNLKRRGSELNISRLLKEGIQFAHGDIRNKADLNFIDHADLIIDASAEPSVMAGLNSGPEYVIDTNLTGTINCLELARKHKAMFVFLSTSRIYPIESLNSILYSEGNSRFLISEKQILPGITSLGISEDFTLTGARSLYGATKLASELLITEYNEFYKIKTVINRCGVISGPWQMGKVDQGFLVLWMARHFYRRGLTYNGFGGFGKQVRDILHIEDLFHLIDWQIHNIDKVNGETMNVGGGMKCSTSLLEFTQICEELTGNHIPIVADANDRVADIRIYITDNTRVINKTKWEPNISVTETAKDIYSWIKKNKSELTPFLL